MATGWGNKLWGSSEWGDLSDETVVVSSIVATSSIGSSTVEANADVTASSLLATSSPGQLSQDISLDLPVTGIEATSSLGQAVSGIGIEQSGIEITSSSGSVTIDDQFLIGAGWGRETWGSFVWGDAYSVLANGISLTATIGNEDAFTDVTVAVSGIELQSAITPVGTSANSDHEIAQSFLLTGSLGDLTFQGNALVQPTNQEPLFNFTAQGNAQLSTAQAKFGSASLLLDGTDDYVDTTTNLDLSSGDFTVDVWIRPDNVTGYKGIWQSGTSTTEQSYLLGNQVYWTVNPSTIITTSVTVNANEWTMLSYEREGNTHRIYKNGTLEDTATTANKQDNGVFSIGKNGFGDFDGYIDEFRVSDIARYGGSSFTEPTQAFSFDSDTQFLLHFDGPNGSTVIKSADDTLFASTSAIGDVVGGTIQEVPVSGIQLTTNLGNSDQIGNAVISLTGIQATGSVGDIVPVSIYDATGSQVTASVGQVTAIGQAVVIPTGISLTASTGSPNIIAWAEVNVGTSVTWTEVDLAA
jgi:hypothetical protein